MISYSVGLLWHDFDIIVGSFQGAGIRVIIISQESPAMEGF